MKKLTRGIILLLAIYFFILGVRVLGGGFELLGEEMAKKLISSVSNPLIGVFVGVLATSLIQSSSATTSMVVGIVSTQPAFLVNAIPIVMGANVGTSVTNTAVSFGHATREKEFSRAVAGATVHDFFNIMAVLVLLPIELFFHPLQKGATFLASRFAGIGGFQMVSPIKVLTDPVRDQIISILQSLFHGFAGPASLVVSIAIIILALKAIVSMTKELAEELSERLLSKHLFGSTPSSFGLGVTLTGIIQSSSITTSLLIPFIGAGMLSLGQIFPFVLGANVGTTFTTVIAALGAGTTAGLTIAFVHLLFNMLAILLLYPLRKIPITLAKKLGDISKTNKKIPIAYVLITFYILPLIYILLVKGGI